MQHDTNRNDTKGESLCDSAPPISVSRFIEISGLSPVTVWRWEKIGRLRIVRIAGRKYITARELREFNRRLEAGEFAGKIPNPCRGAKAKSGAGTSDPEKRTASMEAGA